MALLCRSEQRRCLRENNDIADHRLRVERHKREGEFLRPAHANGGGINGNINLCGFIVAHPKLHLRIENRQFTDKCFSPADGAVNDGGEGGLTRFARRYSALPWASPLRGQRRRCSKTLPAFLCGQPTHVIRGLSNGQLPVVEPRSGILTPPLYLCNMRKKKPAFTCELFFKEWW